MTDTEKLIERLRGYIKAYDDSLMGARCFRPSPPLGEIIHAADLIEAQSAELTRWRQAVLIQRDRPDGLPMTEPATPEDLAALVEGQAGEIALLRQDRNDLEWWVLVGQESGERLRYALRYALNLLGPDEIIDAALSEEQPK